MSKQNLIPLEENQGVMGARPSSSKFNSTRYNTTKAKFLPQAKDSKQELMSQDSKVEGECIEDEDELSFQESAKKMKWVPKQFDQHGYLIKRDANNDPIRYDQHGYRVQIDEEGVHHKYNQEGHEVIIENDRHIAYDKQGFIVSGGNRYDDRGYEVRKQNGGNVFYDENGLRVEGRGDEQKKYDQEGNLVIIDENGQMRKYQQDGLQIVQINGKKMLVNDQGKFVRKNDQGEWEMFDPEDGFIIRKNVETGQYQKFDKAGYKIVKDKYGNVMRLDKDGYRVTILGGNEIVLYDNDGYRIEKDQNGGVHRFDKDGFEVVQANGVKRFKDPHGYFVQRDLYGIVSLYDEEGNLVVIDPQTDQHRKYNEQGLEVLTDIYGNRILKDKRGRIVKELEGETYQKYDEQGNKIWLDENGYQVEQDEEGHTLRYDKVGDRVETQYEIEEQDESQKFQSMMISNLKGKKPQRYKYKTPQRINHEEQLSKLLTQNNKILVFDQQDSQVSDLREFHDYQEPIRQVDIEEELDYLYKKQRNGLQFFDDDKLQLSQLKEMEVLQPQAQLVENNKDEALEEAILPIQIEPQVQEEQDHALEQGEQNIPAQIRSNADISLSERSFENEGVQPLQNKSQFDELSSIALQQLQISPGMKNKRGGRSQASFQMSKNETQTVYNYNTVQVGIKNQNTLYDQDEEIESLHEQEWEQQMNPIAFNKSRDNTSKANTNIIFIQEDEDNKDTLSEFVNKSESKLPKERYKRQSDVLSGNVLSIQEIQEQLFHRLDQDGIRERKQFKLSGAPNPLIEYSKTIEAQKKSLQEKMYLEQYYKK